MNSLILRRNLVTIRPHVPMIKFRKGSDGTHLSNSRNAAPAPTPRSSKTPGGSGPVLEDYQLPLKYRRRPIDENEINAINSGGSN